MSTSNVDRIAQAVLYEGYLLYPYRPSVKNRQRWTFGGLVPQAFTQTASTGDLSTMQSQCLVADAGQARLDVKLRFLHLTHRQVGRLDPPSLEATLRREPPFVPVDALEVDGKRHQTWQEAVEREITLGPLLIDELLVAPRCRAFELTASRSFEPLVDAAGQSVGLLIREQQPLAGEIEVSAELVSPGLHKLTLRVTNTAPWESAATMDREQALLHSLISTHAVLHLDGGAFVSLLEPPACWQDAAMGCHQIGLWPVLAGEHGQTDTLLASPIIFYDYPQVADESPGDLFDGGEIDEILTLRIMTLTDEEKRNMAGIDARARAMLERTESLADDQLASLHGTMRDRRYVTPRGDSHAT